MRNIMNKAIALFLIGIATIIFFLNVKNYGASPVVQSAIAMNMLLVAVNLYRKK